MEKREVPIHERNHQQVPHNTVEGEEEHHHEKKSVFQRVKDKAKKIKDTLNMHGHGHEHEGNLDGYSNDEEADDEEVEDPEVHEAPFYETTEDRRFAVEDANSGQRRGDVGNLPHTGEGSQTDGLKYVAGETDTGRSATPERDPHAPKEPGGSHSLGNYESKVTDSTHSRGAEADVDPIVGDFKAVNVSDEPNYGPTGSQDQMSPDKSADKAPTKLENLESIPSQEHEPTTYAGQITSAASSAHGESHLPGNYESKVTDPTHLGGAEADVDPIVGDLKALNVSDEPNYGPTGSQDQFSPDKSANKVPIKRENLESIPSQEHLPTTYAGKITSAASSAHEESLSLGNYESKVTDPTHSDYLTGGAEADVDPVVGDFKAVNVSDEPNYGPTGSQDQFFPDKSADKVPIKRENLESIPSQEHEPTTYAGQITSAASSAHGESHLPGNYESEVTDPTHLGGAEADVDPIVGDLKALNVSDEPNYGPTRSQDQFSPDKSADKVPIKRENLESIPSQEHLPTTYAGKITSAASSAHEESLSPGNYESKVTDPTRLGGAEADVDPIVGDLKALKVSDEPNYGPTRSQDQFSPDKSADKVPIKRENLDSIPSQEHLPTTYAGKITSAASSAHEESLSPGNYESKVTDPTHSDYLTGGAEADVDPVVGDFKAVNVSDEPNYGPTGSQDQFFPDKSADKVPIKRENLESIPSQEHQPTTYAGKITSAASSAHEESHSPGNYESKVTDPTHSDCLTGGAEVDVDPIVGDLKTVNMLDEPNYGPTGSQDQISPDISADKAPVKRENLESIPSQEHQPTTYEGKITSAASSAHGESHSPGNYESKVMDTTHSGGAEADLDPIVGDLKAVNVSDEPNYGPMGSQDQISPDKSADKAPTEHENLESIPLQEHQPTTYAGKITSAASALAGTAVSVKGAVASMFGYGSKNEKDESGEGGDQKSSAASEN